MNYSVGNKVFARINKIIPEKGCYCSFSRLFGFMPNKLMPSLLDEHGLLLKNKGDKVEVVINKITDNEFIILSDIETYERECEKIRIKEELRNKRKQIEDFISIYKPGTVFETEIIQVQTSQIIIKCGNVEGIIKKEHINWNAVDRLEDLLYEGETIKAVYINHKGYHLYFSLKFLKEKPYNTDLYNLSLTELLKKIGHNSNIFIGQAKQYPYGLFIENLYSANEAERGKLLIDLIFGYNLKAIVLNSNFNVEVDKYYRIELKLVPKNKRLEKNQLFQFVAVNIVETENPYKKDVDLTFAKNTSPHTNKATAGLLAEVGKNMYSSKDRMFFELVQNADDSASKNGVVIHAKTLGDYLIIRHNGDSFDKDDFDAITNAANGTKKANENKTGYKGIGFKSVFTDSDEVFIKTGGYQFKFDKNDERFSNFESFYFLVNEKKTKEEKQSFLEKFKSEYKGFKGVVDIPWQLEPIWVENFPEELGQDFLTSNVAIALKLGVHKIEDRNGYKQAIDNIIIDPKFMLFLRNTNRIDFNGKTVSKIIKDNIITLKNSFDVNRVEYFKREDFEIPVSNTDFEQNDIDIRIKVSKQDDTTGKIIEAKFTDIHNQEIENIPDKIAINNSTEISFAISIDQDGELKPNKKCDKISMFAFLPTLVKDFKFPFYINANFILDPPRQRILGDNPWNFYLMQEIAKYIVRWCMLLNQKQDKNALNILVTDYFDEESSDTQQLAKHFNSAYKTAIETEAFILNHKGELVRQEDIIIDKTDLSAIVGEDLFCLLLGNNKSLPSKKVDSEILDNAIFKKIEVLKFNNIVDIITNNSNINNWFIFATEQEKCALYDWIKKNDLPSHNKALCSFVSNLPLFQFGDEYKSNREVIHTKCIITTEHISPIKAILTKLGFICSDNIINREFPLYEFLDLQNEEELFNSIRDCDFSKLDSNERKFLFHSLIDFDNVGDVKLKSIALFNNMNGEPMPLNEMTEYRENVPPWLQKYVICKLDYSKELSKYLIEQKDEFENIIQKHLDDIDTSFSKLYETYKDDWTGQFTRNIIDKHEMDNDILSIIEESDTKTKEYFLNKIKQLELKSGSFYKKGSYEYRVLQLALSVFDNPSDFSSKIYFDEKCIKNISVSDDVVCDFYQNGEEKKVKMSLATLLPTYKNQSDSINKIKGLFEIKKDLYKFLWLNQNLYMMYTMNYLNIFIFQKMAIHYGMLMVMPFNICSLPIIECKRKGGITHSCQR